MGAPGGRESELLPRLSESENLEIRQLGKEVADLPRVNEILRTASAFFAEEPKGAT